MSVGFTITQIERLTELSLDDETIEMCFENNLERDNNFKKIELAAVRAGRAKIKKLLTEKHMPDSIEIQHLLENWLINEEGFTQVNTPIIISKQMLDKMTITSDHHLSEQVFWLSSSKCLRPMLAPNLYVVMRELHRITSEPVKIFEIGSCFRKESQGAQHMNEFTMLNFVELASVPDGKQMERLQYMAAAAMKAVGINDYEFEIEGSTVYGETLDVVVNGVEVASGSYGPHALDANWRVTDTWVGIGFGIERLALVKEGYKTIKRVGKSIAFIDGIPLNI